MVLKNEEALKKYLKRLDPILAEKISSSQKIADVGCATGQLLQLLAKEHRKSKKSLWGFDISADFVSRAQKSFANVFLLDPSKQELPEKEFDLIFVLDVLEHAENPKKFLENISRSLKNNGLLIVSTPNLGSLSHFIQGPKWFGFKDKTHRSFYDKLSLTKLLNSCHLQIVKLKTISLAGLGFYDKIISQTYFGGQIIALIEKKPKAAVCIYNIGIGNTDFLAKKISFWQEQNIKVKMVCPAFLIADFKKLVREVEYIGIPFCKTAKSKLVLVPELFKRSLLAILYIPGIIRNTDVIYSISSVLDELLLPFFIRIFSRKLTWTVLFENKVVFKKPGDLLIRVLAFAFYKISLLLLKKADKIFVISENLKIFLIEQGFQEKKLILTGNAIDKDQIKMALAQRQAWSDALFLGRISQDKGVFDLIKICQRVKQKYPDFSLWIVGSGDRATENKLKKTIAGLSLKKNIKLFGYVSGFQKFLFLTSCKIFVSLSHEESFGVAILEAVASGRKTIAYDLPAYKQIYLNNEITTVSVGDTKAFSEKVIELLDRKDFDNPAGLMLLNSEKYSYERISKLEMDNFKKP